MNKKEALDYLEEIFKEEAGTATNTMLLGETELHRIRNALVILKDN